MSNYGGNTVNRAGDCRGWIVLLPTPAWWVKGYLADASLPMRNRFFFFIHGVKVRVRVKSVPPPGCPQWRCTPHSTPDTLLFEQKSTTQMFIFLKKWIILSTILIFFKLNIKNGHLRCASSASIVSILSMRSLELHLVISWENMSSLSDRSSAKRPQELTCSMSLF